MRKLYLYFIFVICFAACKSDKKGIQPITTGSSFKIVGLDTLSSNTEKTKPSVSVSKKIFTDTITFIEYDDNGDYPLLFAKKGNQRKTFIYQKEGKINFLRDDELRIQWKADSTWISGEGEKLELREWIVKASKIKDGSVSRYRKQNRKPIKYWHATDDSYTDTFKDYLYTLIEYYLANTKNKLVLANQKADANFSYSIEDGQKEGRSYTIIGLSSIAEGQSNINAWLYLDNETRKFYEYDLAQDKLFEFK
ncbi:hypothetical protein [Pedobacter agri]|uniref:hypothetical protein n=1 Tax=Pedobacter agri TaxID=454586 RepID=UPI002931AA4B|nr:hypothetical protein [Pedobacter agri]